MKRRSFARYAIAAVAGGAALAVGWGLLPPRQRLLTRRPLPMAAGESAFNGWLKVTADDRVIVVMPKCEMGQGVHTGLAMVLADELDADWSRVQIEPSPIDAIYNNLAAMVDGLPFPPDEHGALARSAGWLTAKAMREFGMMMTGGSSSQKDLWLPMREAGAAARAMLVAAAAQAWGVPAGEVQVAEGVLSHASGRRARFGELAAAAAAQPLPREVALKTAAQWRLIGKPLARLDSAAKSRGGGAGAAGPASPESPGYALDLPLPGLLHASVVMCPTLGGRVAGFDAASAQGPGLRHAFAVAAHHGGTAGVAVVAERAWQALQGTARVAVRWDEAVPAASFDSRVALDGLARTLDEAGAGAGLALQRRGDVQAALQGAAKTLRAEYRAPWLLHATLEPQNCTVRAAPGAAEVWAPTQVPDLARHAVARVLGLADEQVRIHVTWLGGGFGRRLEVDFIAQAAEIAGEMARRSPDGRATVRTLWSREQDSTHDFYRPGAVARLSAALDAKGRLLAWQHISAGQAILPQVLARHWGLPAGLTRQGPDKTALEGAFDQPYEWPAARVAHLTVDLPVPVGYWRSVGHSHQAFFKECFLDEVAQAAGADPLAFRLALLQAHPRHAAVLQRAAAMAGWGTPLAPAADGAPRARGLALHASFGSVVAQVAEVSLGADRAIRVHRVCCAIDCGTPVNPNLILQQMEGAVVFGLSAALSGEVQIVQGRVQTPRLDDQRLLRLAESPEVEVAIMPSTAPPEGVGEPGVPPVAPAVANALFALTGQRLRSLPLRLA